jgi:hypothetical protein
MALSSSPVTKTNNYVYRNTHSYQKHWFSLHHYLHHQQLNLPSSSYPDKEQVEAVTMPVF